MTRFGQVGAILLSAAFVVAIGAVLIGYGPRFAFAAVAGLFGPMLIGLAYFLGDAFPVHDDGPFPGIAS